MRFTFRPVLSIVMLIALAILVSLGTWQLKRLEWKQGLISAVEARTHAEPIPYGQARDRQTLGEDMVYAPVTALGIYVHAEERHVFGTWEGRPGWYIFTPLQVVAPGARVAPRHIWVNRGFVPDELKEPEARPEGQIEEWGYVTGLFRTAEEPAGIAKMVSAPNLPEENQWHVRDPRLFGPVRGLDEDGTLNGPIAYEDGQTGYYIDIIEDGHAGDWPRGGTTRLDFNNRHLEYALTWFGLAAAMLAVFFAFSLKSRD